MSNTLTNEEKLFLYSIKMRNKLKIKDINKKEQKEINNNKKEWFQRRI